MPCGAPEPHCRTLRWRTLREPFSTATAPASVGSRSCSTAIGRDGQAFHRDTDMRWLDDTVIAILSLGARRPWLLRPRANRYDHSEGKGAVLDIAPGSGDLLVMGGRSQADWEPGALPAAGSIRCPHLHPMALHVPPGPPVRGWVLPRAAQVRRRPLAER